MQPSKLDEEVLDIAVYNDYIIRNEDGTLRPAQKGLDIVERMILADPKLLFKVNVDETADVLVIIYRFVDSMIQNGHIEDEE